MSKNEKKIILNIIKNHDIVHAILDPNNKKLNEEFKKFKKDYKDIFLELFLLAMADTLGSQLKENKPENFRFRIKFYKKILKNY